MKGFYINLNERVDRMRHFENMKIKYHFLKNIKRFPAIKNKNGAIGCGMSHIEALKNLQKYDDNDDDDANGKDNQNDDEDNQKDRRQR